MADKASPAARRRVRSTWVARSPSPSANQVSPPSAASAAMKAQVSSRRGEAGERVHDGVEIGGDGEAEMLEVVAGIGDHHEIAARHDAAEPQRELGAADAAAQRDDEALSRIADGAHRNKSSSAARISAAAGAGGPDQVSPRTSTIGRASS